MDKLQALILRWRAEGARIDTFHATMGSGYKVCADQLEAALAAVPPDRSQPWCSSCGHPVYLHDGQKCAVEGGCKYGCVDEPSVLGAGSGPAPMPTQADRAAAAVRYQRADDADHQQDWPTVAAPPTDVDPVSAKDRDERIRQLNADIARLRQQVFGR